ncbi:MAG: leucine-rich repeat domain-containing protein, partial [Clostridiales bacterium]|nr:leucine-rich repeat domain-containing protein [Clostridiales bacterium]
TIDSTKTGNPYTDTTTWSGKNINFNEEGTPITLTFTITNLSTSRPLYAKVTNTSTATNLNVEVGGATFIETQMLTLTAKVDGSTTNTTALEITMSVADDNESVTGNYGFTIELNSEKPEEIQTVAYWNSLETGALDFDFDATDASNLIAAVKRYDIERTTGELIIPSKVKDTEGNVYTVTSVADKAFYYLDPDNGPTPCNITSVSLPNTITNIGEAAFRHTNITNISIPDSVVTIEYEAFSVTSLTNIEFGSGLKTIGNSAFESANIQNLEIPDSVETIEAGAFVSCANITTVTIGSGVTSIGNGVFSGCGKLTSITITATKVPTLGGTEAIPSNVTEIRVPNTVLASYKTASNWSNFETLFVGY